MEIIFEATRYIQNIRISGLLNQDLQQQISDFIIIPFILSNDIFSLNGLLGYGLGAQQLVVRDLANIYFGIQDTDMLFGTRFLIFSLLLEVGFLGLISYFIVWLRIVRKYISSLKIKDTWRAQYLHAAFVISLFGDTYFFVICFIVIISFIQTKKLN